MTGRAPGRLRQGLMIAVAAFATIAIDAPSMGQDGGGRGGRGGNAGDRGGDAGGRGGDRGGRGGGFGGQQGGRGGQAGRGGGMGMMGMGGAMAPDYLRRDLQTIVRELGLDDDQRPVVEALVFDYEAAFGEATEALREELRGLRPDQPDRNDPEVQARRESLRDGFRALRDARRDIERRREAGEEIDPAEAEGLSERLDELRAQAEEFRPQMPQGDELEELRDKAEDIMRRWRQTRRDLASRFETDLSLLLNEEQLELWPAVDRTIHREKAMQYGRLSGEGVDLFLVVAETGLEGEALEEVLDAYSIDLDVVLRARDTFMESSGLERMYAFMTRDTDAVVAIAEEEARKRVAVRSVNDRYSDTIYATILQEGDETSASTFNEAFRRRAYDRIFAPTFAERSFAAARELEDLTPEVREAIEEFAGAYMVELAAKNGELVYATRLAEPGQDAARMRRIAERMASGERGGFRGGDDEDDPIRALYQSRSELDDRYRASLESVLTPEQIEQLPQRRGGGRGGAGGNEDFRARMMERFDTDGDGELSDTEREAAREAMREMRGGGGGRRGGGDDN